MRNSKVLKKLRSGMVAYCTQIGSGFAPFAGMAAQSGFDCIWLDHEHKSVSYENLIASIMTATIYDCDTVFRILKRSYADYFRPLEDGATGVMIPHCKTKSEAEFAVYNTKFYPIGLRGMDTSCLGCDCMMSSSEQVIEHSLSETFTMIQIEDIESLDNIDDIASVEGVDILFVGPADLTQSAKRHGIYFDGFLFDAYDRVNNACEKRDNLWWGTSVGSREAAKIAYDRGARFISMRGDFGAVKKGLADTINDLNDLFG